ncbi:anthranilate synthase component I family protein [Natronospora cellulosivora (SeqCode)]
MMSLAEFLEHSRDYNLIPIYEEIAGDTITPITVYSNLCLHEEYSYLLESAGQGRYSFIGVYPEFVINKKKEDLEISYYDDKGGFLESQLEVCELIDYMKDFINQYNLLELEGLPPFSGGFVGYFAYEMINDWEAMYHNEDNKEIQQSDTPMSTLVYSSVIIAIDHFSHTVKIISNIRLHEEMSDSEKEGLYYSHKSKIDKVVKNIKELSINGTVTNNNLEYPDDFSFGDIESNTSKSEFASMVNKAKDYIKEGDAFQIVLSQKFAIESNVPPFKLYRALRMMNPSPYLFYLNFPEIKLIGSSPEVLIKVENKKVLTRPLAGTRPRGKNSQEDLIYKEDLLSDEKEKAEHLMLVDLGRNDLGMVCKPGSVKVTELMDVEYFSRVMHIVSEVEGELADNYSSLDALKSVFPAGTVSGAPKIRAMEIIDELEKDPRGVYAGAVGYIDLKGNLDTCITIRTIYQIEDKIFIQVGAGIVTDSVPEKEYDETLNKARALFQSLKIIREDGSYDLSYR